MFGYGSFSAKPFAEEGDTSLGVGTGGDVSVKVGGVYVAGTLYVKVAGAYVAPVSLFVKVGGVYVPAV